MEKLLWVKKMFRDLNKLLAITLGVHFYFREFTLGQTLC